MRAFAIDHYGEKGSVRILFEPEPGEGEVRVRIEAVGLNPADFYMMNGAYKDFMPTTFPLIPGVDMAGTVDEVGRGVTDLAKGDRVFGSRGKMVAGEGSLAELGRASADALARRPASLDPEFAAALPLAGVSALRVMEAAELNRGDNVLVLGAAGGIGTRDGLERLLGLVADGTLKRPEISTFPLEEAAAAYEKLASRHLRGKLVVVP